MRSLLLTGVCAWTLATVLAGPMLNFGQFFTVLKCLPRPKPMLTGTELAFYHHLVTTLPTPREVDHGFTVPKAATTPCYLTNTEDDQWKEFIQLVADIALTTRCVREMNTPACFDMIKAYYGTTPTRLSSSELQTLADNMCGMAETARDLMNGVQDRDGQESLAKDARRYDCASDHLQATVRAIAGIQQGQDTPQQDQDTLQESQDAHQEDQDISPSTGFSWSSLDPVWSAAGTMATLGGLFAAPLTGWARGQGGVATQRRRLS